VDLPEAPVGQLLRNRLSSLPSRMALHALHFPNYDFLYALLPAQGYKLLRGLVDDVVQLAVAFSKDVLLGGCLLPLCIPMLRQIRSPFDSERSVHPFGVVMLLLPVG